MTSPSLSAALGRLARAADPDPPADGRLVARFARTRDPDAFAELVRRLGPMVLGVCRRVTGDAHLADDAFQAAFLVLVRRAADVRPAEAVRAWVYGVAVRVAREARAVSARRRAREAPVPTLPDFAAEPQSPPDADALRALDEEVAALPEHLRAAVVLCELDGESRRDAAARLGVPEGTLSSRLAKGRKLLADRLRKRGVTATGLAVLAPAVVPARLTAAASALVSGPAPAAVAVLAHGVVRAMVLHKFRAVPVVLALFAVAALAAGASAPAELPRPVVVPLRVTTQPPAPKAKAPPVGIVVARSASPFPRFDQDGKKLGEINPPDGVRFMEYLSVSPDSTRVAVAAMPLPAPAGAPAADYSQGLPCKLVVRPVTGPGEPKVFDILSWTFYPHWMPDGKGIVIARAKDIHRRVYENDLLDPVTGQIRPLALPDGCRVLDVARDGKTFLVEYREKDAEASKLALAEVGGATVKPLADLQKLRLPVLMYGRLSPDGTRVLFTDGDPTRKDAHRQGRSQRPYLLDVATGKRQPLADFPENGTAIGVAWSPDGRRVAYTWSQLHPDLLAKDTISGEAAERETEAFLMVADADGRNAQTVASCKGTYHFGRLFEHIDWR